MFRHAIYIFAFVLSLTTAQAETPENYFGVSAVLDGELSPDGDQIVDTDFASGYVLSYGRTVNDNLAVELSYANYADTSAGGFLETELNALEISGVFKTSNDGPFVRLGYGDGDLTSPLIDLNTFRIVDIVSASESGPIFGVGLDLPILEGANLVRFEYNLTEFDTGEISRLTIGTLVRF